MPMPKKIDYPVEPHNIVLLGKPANFVRSFIVRPLLHGKYSLIIGPKFLLGHHNYLHYPLFFPDLYGAPAHVKVDIPSWLRKQHEWEWRLVRWPDYLQETLAIVDEGENSTASDEEVSLAELVYLHQAAASGYFMLDETRFDQSHKLVVWSCNQPFETGENGDLQTLDSTEPVLSWYENQVDNTNPDLIWILGDAAYSDGTSASNFIDTYYNRPGWARNPRELESLTYAYRNMYRGHWSFKALQKTMRHYAHIGIWDDHEIRDGWGSEDSDFHGDNAAIYNIARKVSEEYLLGIGPRVRDIEHEPEADAHQAYFKGNVATFIFDGRSSRKYHDQQGHVISPQQFNDFSDFCEQVSNRPEIKYVIMGCGVPFINLKDFVEQLGSRAPKALTDLIAGIRDDVRDSWHSPGNKEALKQLIAVLKKMHRRRGDIDIINLSGDIHVANAYTFQPIGFTKVMYQITTSALTNRQHMPKIASELLSVGTQAFSDVLGVVTRVWEEVSDPNVMIVSNHGEYLRFELKVYDLDNPNVHSLNSIKDKTLDVGAHSLTLGYVI